MNRTASYHIFWSNTSPLACLSGAALLIMASDRLAHAIIIVGALVWVYCLSALSAYAGVRFFPRRGRLVLLAFLSSFLTGVYLLLLWMLSPLCALQTFFIISFVPIFCVASTIFKRLETLSLEETVSGSFSESLILGALIIIFALIREPLGYLSLSLPGGAQGIILLFSFQTEYFLPIYLIAGSSGALILLGYCLGLHRYLRAKYVPQEGKDDL
jgi:hypothetical protein